ncbi:MAG: tRNA (adenosine(37)-N6)-threonylcarbamoyltransferase complex ATPase subunit type 1 TsaE [Armatimonadetes bacterium]|nr:tRNA (adenosine(37)-N6)-threonylcarbamoyltransferase complex ATPase subunit type 1 TsaE [Armatimonadota bacterium]
MVSRVLGSEEETLSFGRLLARVLKAGDVVALRGELGAGKTTLVRGILTGLGHLEPVRSPTYNLIQTFETTPPVMHADLYRLKGESLHELNDYFETHLCLIEWPERIPNLPFTAEIHLEISGDSRLICLSGIGADL